MKTIYIVTMLSNTKDVIKQTAFLTIEAARRELAKQYDVESKCNAYFGREPITNTLEHDFFIYQGPIGKTKKWECMIETVTLCEE